MAVNPIPPKANDAPSNAPGTPASEFKGRYLSIGANVALTVVLATVIVVVLQWMAFSRTAKLDMTDRGINSVTEGTERLLGSLDQRIRLTSMYFETDLEGEDQKKYRNRLKDLLNLYQAANRSKVEIETLNPLQDHAARERAIERIRNLEKFQTESEQHRELIDRYRNEIAGQLVDLLQSELDTIASLQVAAPDDPDLAQLPAVLDRWREELTFTAADVAEAVSGAQPRYGTAASTIATAYTGLAKQLTNIAKFGQQQISRKPDASPDLAAYFADAEDRFRTTINLLEGEATKARQLPRLEFESLLREIGPTANALVIESETDARVVSFRDLWPPVDPYIVKPAFKDRLFKGEEKITSAILQMTHEEQTAVTFVRYGGQPLFMGGAFRGQAPAAYSRIKGVLEDANFVVNEWDLQSAETPPEVDPQPVRTIFVVLRPSQNPLQFQFRQPQQPPFGEVHRQRLLTAMGEDPRAIFLAGWAPGPFAAMPAPYEYGEYLSTNFGIEVLSNLLLINAVGVGPGQFRLTRQSIYVSQYSRSDNIVVKNMRGKPASFPLVAPLQLAAEPPEGVTVNRLMWSEKSEGLWGVKDIQKYQQKSMDEHLTKEPDDVYGPFTIAATAEKGDAKIVVVGSRDAMTDQVAMSQFMALTSEGFTVRPRNPGNLHLLMNSVHWLNDRVEWMDIGRPVDLATLEIDEGPTLTFVRWFVFAIWPAFGLFGAGVAWWIRRR